MDAQGRRWTATVISHGRTSQYLNPKVHRPVVEFACLDSPVPRRYAGLKVGSVLEELSADDLMKLFEAARTH